MVIQRKRGEGRQSKSFTWPAKGYTFTVKIPKDQVLLHGRHEQGKLPVTISVKNGKSIAAEWKIFPWEFARTLGLCNAEFSLSIVVGPRNFKLTEAPGKRQKQVQILFEGIRIQPKL